MASDHLHSSYEEHYTTASLSFNEAADPSPLPRIHRVHPKLRENNQVYDPAVLSLGPYHHGKPEFWHTEEFKTEVFNMFVSASKGKDVEAWNDVILRRIGDIRRHYEEVEWNDEELARIILRDACFLIQWTENSAKVTDLIIDRLGASMAVLMARDIYVLENQIPYCVITLLCDKRFDRPGMNDVLSTLYFMDPVSPGLRHHVESEDSCRKQTHKPLHFLEAYRTRLIGQEPTDEIFRVPSSSKLQNKSPAFFLLTDHSPFHSATYLRKKGIEFKPTDADTFSCRNTTTSTVTFMKLKNIRFTPGGVCGGTLWLPICSVNKNTMALFSNIIAFELSPGKRTDYTVTSYVNLMKSLIETPEDIKLLQESRILYSSLGNDDEVVKVFDEIVTFGVGDRSMLADVIKSVNDHCNNHGKTWMAELNHKYFNSPWSATALIAATLLLILTFLQTLFTILPDDDKPCDKCGDCLSKCVKQ